MVKTNLNKLWDFSCLSAKKIITWDIIQEYPDLNWDYYELSRNPNITWDIVLSNPNKEWNYDMLTVNPNITIEIIKNNLDKPWNFNILSNMDRTIERDNYILKYLQKKFMEPGGICEELMKVMHSPKNFHKFYDWGFIEDT